MIGNAQNQNLAETLKRCGLVASATEAARMAEHIAITEKKVTSDFDQHKTRIENGLSRGRERNVDEIIEKTRFDKKEFYVPVKGYDNDRALNRPMPQERATPAFEAPKTEPKRAEMIPVESVHIEKKEKTAPVSPKPEVYTDIIDDERAILEIMNEEAEKVYMQPTAAPQPVEKPALESSYSTHSVGKEVEVSPEVGVQLASGDQPLPEPKTVDENEPPKKKEFKNPIEKVDLMKHFNFGSR